MKTDLFLQERREQIIAHLEHEGRVSVAELSRRFGISKTTIRADLDALYQQGLLLRTHGGALVADKNDPELSFEVRRHLHSPQKQHIGAAAAELVEPGDAIILDASTTALAMASQLKKKRDITVATNGIMIALCLHDCPTITVLMPGGFFRHESFSLVGANGANLIKSFNFRFGFFSAKGLTLEDGLTDVNNSEVLVKQDMISISKKVIAMIDSSKWGRIGFAPFAALQKVHYIITDTGAPPSLVAAIREMGIEVIIV